MTEIVSQAGWASGNPMAFLIEHVSGTGSRWVESYYTSTEYAALTGGSGVVPALEVRGPMAPSPPSPPPMASPPPPMTSWQTWSVKFNEDAAEEDAATGAMYLTSSDLEIPFDGADKQVIGIVFPSVELNADSTCLTPKECGATASALGLQLSGNGYAFAGNYGTKGCYAYSSGGYAGMAFFGTGGTEAQMATALTGSKYRPLCEIANTHLGMTRPALNLSD